jgi:L-threonylcarbamoyladenylate synthase
MILYPTETIYALGVHALDERQIAALFTLKGRNEGKAVSWLVRNIADIERYAHLSPRAVVIAEKFLPGSLTLVLPARDTVPRAVIGPDRTIGFRISPDAVAREVITAFMDEYNAPLTCTSANVSGLSTAALPEEILMQFGERAAMIRHIYDDGIRTGTPSTVVRVEGDVITVLREGAIPSAILLS